MANKTHTAESILAYTEQVNGCLLWKGAKAKNGYGKVTINYKTRSTHKVVYEAVKGFVPQGLVIHHTCKNKHCVNPKHLQAITSFENVVICEEIGPTAINYRKTHCKNGHELAGSNLYICPRGRRECKTCRQAAVRRYLKGE